MATRQFNDRHWFRLATRTGEGAADTGTRPILMASLPSSDESSPLPRGRILAVLVAGTVVVSVICAAVLTRRDPALGERVGSIVADE